MNYEIIAVPNFLKEVKKLSKKYASLKSDLSDLFLSLEKNPTLGTPLGRNCFKIRLAITSKSKGKSAGARIITNFTISENKIYLLSIFDKSNKESLTDKELIDLFKSIE
ncbi:hypothetical protein EOJ36_09005 [Sandaracinomonas limnophila]|uniref:Addiction module toxin RelE n=1 Tax=Sandaracinomonas limnophila TaxID=1862386 RepID=A0A437PP52_9BACT|nr:hypothetical protein [Sandaracinomonas limnophila]RVU24056.1 hypothetical protein EOJ36_09005 [Sandaracinomonas limnophila]